MIRDFNYFAPKTLKKALDLLDKYKDEAKIIAGGQSLLILMKQGLVAPEYLIDIKSISELDYIKFNAKNGLRIGALTTHRAIEKSPLLAKRYSVLPQMERRLASVQTRNWGTIGGNLCHGDPAGDPAPVMIALKAVFRLSSAGGTREKAAEDFYLDYFETALEPGEMLTEIWIPPVLPRTGTSYTKFNIIDSDMATVSAAVSISLTPKQNRCSDVRIVLGAAAPTPKRATQAEDVLRGRKVTDALLAEAGEVAASEAEPVSDISASDEYRRELVNVLVKRVGKEALTRAQGA